MKKEKTQNGFLTDTLAKYTISNLSAYFLSCLGTVVTGIMSGLLIDESGLAVVSFCLPVYYFFAALGTLILTGTSVLAASMLGANDKRAADRYYTLAFVASAAVSAVLIVIGVIFSKQIAFLLGARDDLLQDTANYLKVLFIGSPMAIFIYFPINYLRLTDKPGLAPVCYLIQAVAVISLNYILIRKMGVVGAAWANVIANTLLVAVGTILVFVYSHFKLVSIKNCREEVLAFTKAGSSMSLDCVSCLVRAMVLNTVAYKMGGTIGICVIGVIASIAEFCAALVIGVPQASVPLVAIFNSERDTLSVRKTFKSSLLFGVVLVAEAVLVIEFTAPYIISLFGLSGDEAALCLRVFAPSLIIGIVNFTFITFHATVRREIISNICTVLRSAVFIVIYAFVISGFSENIVLLTAAFPVAEVLTLAVIIISALIMGSKKDSRRGLLLLDERVERSGRIIAFQVKNDPESIVACSTGISEFCDNNDITPKQSMAISLSIEEMLVALGQMCYDGDKEGIIDVRLFCQADVIGLRIRNGGKRCNIIEYAKNNPDNLDCLGIKMIERMTEVVEYSDTFGVNNLLVLMK